MMDREADALTGLSWTSEDVKYHFVKEDDAWINVDDADFPTNQDAVESLADRLLTMEANRKLTDVEDASDYGITEDSFTVTAQWSDGSETRFTLGDETPFADGWYLQSSDDAGTVYASPSALDSMFSKTLIDLAEQEEIPKVETASRLVIGEALDVARAEDDDRFDPDHRWYDTATGEPMDDDGVEDVLSTFSAVKWHELVCVSATEEELSQWHLDDASATALTVYGDDSQECTLLLGGEDADGDCYARLPDSTMVYTISCESADRLFAATADSLRSTELFTLAYDNVRAFAATMDGEERTFEVPEEDSNGDAATDQDAEASTDSTAEEGDAASSAEETIDETEALWNRIADLSASASTDEAPSGGLLLEIRVTNTSGISLSCAFYLYDVDNYLAAMSDNRSFLVSAADVDALIRALRQ